jgi:hypothetical protein
MKFACRRCGQRLEVPEDAAGQKFPCPACGESVVVPPAVIAPGFAPRRPIPPAGVRRSGGLAAVGKLLGLGLLVAAGAFAYAMYVGHESASQVWQQWRSVAEAKLGAAKLDATVAPAAPMAPGPVTVADAPAANPLPAIEATPTPTPTPTPAIAATPTPVPVAALPAATATPMALLSRPRPVPASNATGNALDTLVFGNANSEQDHTLAATDSAVFQGELVVYGPGEIWGGEDTLIFHQQRLAGDGWIQARVTTPGSASGWTKVGVMMRETLEPNARNAFALVSYNEGVHSQWRTDKGGGTGQDGYAGPTAGMYWVRVERQHETFIMSASSDGQTWSEISRRQIAMGPNIYLGLANSAASLETINYATFDHISSSVRSAAWTDSNIGKTALHGGTITNGLGEPSRRLLPREPNDYYGGDLTFRMKVDPDQQNYCTVKLWGAEGGDKMGRIALVCEGKEIGQRHGPGLDIFVHTDGPVTPGAFWYRTTILPRWLTKGKTSVELKLRSMGDLFAYGSIFNYDTYQHKLTQPTRGLYRIYTHINPVFAAANEVQGTPPDYAHAPVRPAPDERAQIAAREKDANEHFSDLLRNSDPSQGDAAALAEAYGVTWTVAYKKAAVAAQALKALDATCRKFVADPKLAGAEWGGNFGPSGYALALLAPEMGAALNESVDLGAGAHPRREQYAAMLKASVDAGRFGRQAITNQALINATNIYHANRGLLALGSKDALTETEGKRYYREAAGMEEWRGDDLPGGGSKWNLGHGVLMMTTKGTSHEWNWCCANCYGRMDPYVYEMYRFSGDPAFRDRAVQIERAHDYMVYPSVDEGGYRAMLNEGVICTRNVYHPGHTFYGYANVVSSLLDRGLLGGVRQGLGDGQFLDSWQPSEATVFFPDDFARLKAGLNVNRALPTTPGQPDFAWADEQNAVLSIKHGAEQHFLTFARRANAIHHIGDAHSITPQGERVVQFWVDDVRFTPSGEVQKVGPEVESDFTGTPPDHPVSAWAGQLQPKAKPEFGPPGGLADFYSVRYGDYVIAMNCTFKKSFEFKPEDMMSGVDLVSGQRMLTPVQVPPQTTVVFYAPERRGF